MTHVIFDLCIRDGACVEVCPVECIVPGFPASEWPWYYVDPDTCIDCGACVPECPVEAVLPEEDLASEYQQATGVNALYFIEGPGYAALELAAGTTAGEELASTAQFQRNFSVAPNTDWIYIFDSSSGSVIQFAVDAETGALNPTDNIFALNFSGGASLVFKR